MSRIPPPTVSASWSSEGADWALLVHGGAGIVRGAQRGEAVRGCRTAASGAAEVLRAGGSALDAVQRAVVLLEDNPSFNAGTGACLNADEDIELDAGIMEGTHLRAGGVCAMPPFLHPILVARAVLDEGRHVLYAAAGAERFALRHGFVRANREEMTTRTARENWLQAHAGRTPAVAGGGTVGAVARDRNARVAAATSTGGLVHKQAGRVGDSPLFGAGTYADDDSGACSATGDGEAAIRVCLARSAIDLMRQRAHPEEAARTAIRAMGDRVGGTGGVILVDRFGRLGWARNAAAMAWAASTAALADIAADA